MLAQPVSFELASTFKAEVPRIEQRWRRCLLVDWRKWSTSPYECSPSNSPLLHKPSISATFGQLGEGTRASHTHLFGLTLPSPPPDLHRRKIWNPSSKE